MKIHAARTTHYRTHDPKLPMVILAKPLPPSRGDAPLCIVPTKTISNM